MISDCNATGNLIHSFGFITCRQMIQRSKSLAPGPWPLSPPADPPDSTSAATGGFPNRTSTNSISTTANLSRSLQPLASASNCSSLCDFRPNRNVAEDTADGPVAAAGLAEVARLRVIVVIVIAEFGVGRIAPWALPWLGSNVLQTHVP